LTPKDKAPDTPLPPVGHNGMVDHVQMSERFQGHTTIEIGKGNRLQASEKIWASVAHALKAVAQRRGWKHNSHPSLRAIADQLGREKGAVVEYYDHMNSAENMHTNFYENIDDWHRIEMARRKAEEFIALLKQDLNQHPFEFSVDDASDRDRLNLLGAPDSKGGPRKMPKVKVGDTSSYGFSPNFAPKAVKK